MTLPAFFDCRQMCCTPYGTAETAIKAGRRHVQCHFQKSSRAAPGQPTTASIAGP